MDINELMMLTDEDIDYSNLSEETLKELALGDELFMATSALGELSRRKSSLAALIADEILSQSLGDCYLQANALEVLFDLNRKQALDYISEKGLYSNSYILNTIMELMIENESDFKRGSALSLITFVKERLKEFGSCEKFLEPEVRDYFLKLYGSIENIQTANTVISG